MASFKLDISEERLWRGDQPLPISNKAFQLLRLFVSNPNRLLTKDRILEDVWQGVCVSEGLIKEYVHDLRQALDDDPRNPQFIETVHGRGYRFLGGAGEGEFIVRETGNPETRVRPASVTILPFVNITGEDRWTRFSRGLVDDLVTEIGRYPDLMVIATAATPNCGPEGEGRLARIDADYSLTGSIQESAGRLRINVKLIETKSGKLEWTDCYERKIGELFMIQYDIVGHVASAIGGFSGQIPHIRRQGLWRRPPKDLHAYELYLLGYELEFEFRRQSALRAVELLKRATRLDPGFSRAWLVLGWTYWQIALEDWDDDKQRYRGLLHEAFEKAASLDPLDPFAVMELAAAKAVDGETTSAFDGLERAIDLGKNQADLLIKIANYLATVMDDPQRAVEALDQGLMLTANVSKWHHMSVTRVAYFAGDFSRSIAHSSRAADNLPTRLFELMSLAQAGRDRELSERGEAFAARYPRFDPLEYVTDHPIAAADAKRLFLDGIQKAGLC
jgi:TolB-like protein